MEDFALHCFLAVAETGSFTKGAERVRRTQSAVTQQIGKLEKQLGRMLFTRGRAISLTPDGALFLGYAQKIVELYSEVVDRFANPELKGEVTIGVPEDFATKFLSEILMDFSRIHPRILLNVECDLTVNLFNRFKKGHLDMVLVKMVRPEDFPQGVEVWSEPLEWVGGGHFMENFDVSKPLPLILAPEPCIYRARALDALNVSGIRWRMAFTSPSYVGTLSAVQAGMGLTVLPRTLIPEQLTLIKEKGLPVLPDIHVSLLKKGESNRSLESLEDFLLEKFGRVKTAPMIYWVNQKKRA